MAPNPSSVAAAHGGSQGDAVLAVLGNADLLTEILRLHAAPTLVFGKLNCKGLPYDDKPCARWAASQVSRLFRETALRLPWKVIWDARSSKDFVAVCGRPGRNLLALDLSIRQQTLADCATLLRYASPVQDLRVTCWGGGVLDCWLLRTRVLAGNFLQGKTVLAHLASLKDLRSIRVGSAGYAWTNASWLAKLSQLSGIELYRYAGPPVALALPNMKSLRVSSYDKKVNLAQWAMPGLTDLGFTWCTPFPPFDIEDSLGIPGSACSSDRTWLHGLKRLELCSSRLDLLDTSLGQLLPSLTYLNLVWGWGFEPGFGRVFSRGLPASLRELRVYVPAGREPEHMWPAVFTLRNLVHLEVGFRQEGASVQDAAALAEGLSSLGPQLMVVNLTLPAKPGFRTGLGSLEALLRSRGGSLSLNVVTGAGC